MRSKYFNFIVISYLIRLSSGAFAGPYDLVPVQLGKCEPSECANPKLELSNYKIRKLDRSTYVYTGTYNHSIPMDDNVTVTVDVSVWGNGGWKPNFYHFDVGGMCTGFKKYFPSYVDQLESMINETCPLPPGVYSVENVNLNIKIPLLDSLVYGKYKNVVKGFNANTNECVLCLEFFCDCIPKRTKKQSRT